MNLPFVSIVSPVYNVEKYLGSFIDSILNQTFAYWELILINDGSTDNSGAICEQYARVDKRLRVIHQKNKGVSSARNVGIKASKGTWLFLPDADDIVDPYALETLLSYTGSDVDLVSAGYQRYALGKFIPEKCPAETKKMPILEYIEVIGKLTGIRNLDRYCWNKLFRLSIIRQNNICFHEDIYFREDILYIYEYLMNCRSNVMCTSYSMYSYYMRESGAAKSTIMQYTPKTSGKFISMTRCYDILEQMDGVSLEVKNRMKAEILCAYNSVFRLIGDDKKWKKDRQALRTSLRKYFSRKELLVIHIRRAYRKLFSFATKNSLIPMKMMSFRTCRQMCG